MKGVIVEQPVTPVRRRWMCVALLDTAVIDAPAGALINHFCAGEMRSIEGPSQELRVIVTSWQHICDKCGRKEWSETAFPTIVFKDIDNAC